MIEIVEAPAGAAAAGAGAVAAAAEAGAAEAAAGGRGTAGRGAAAGGEGIAVRGAENTAVGTDPLIEVVAASVATQERPASVPGIGLGIGPGTKSEVDHSAIRRGIGAVGDGAIAGKAILLLATEVETVIETVIEIVIEIETCREGEIGRLSAGEEGSERKRGIRDAGTMPTQQALLTTETIAAETGRKLVAVRMSLAAETARNRPKAMAT